uniref:BLUF domain-containing protein n=1 Tax=Anolis carolinensis TaxID=28377 RepID=A0A803TKJ3_ANOCA
MEQQYISALPKHSAPNNRLLGVHCLSAVFLQYCDIASYLKTDLFLPFQSSSDVLYNILRDLRNMEQQQRVLVLDAKILIMSHNLPSRLFQQWHYKVLNVPERRLDYDTSQEESAETLTHECLTALLKIGKHLLKYPKSPKNLPDTILEKVPDLIIPQDTICYLLTCQELLSPAQYLQFFDSPLNIQMDSGIGQIVERTVRDGEKDRLLTCNHVSSSVLCEFTLMEKLRLRRFRRKLFQAEVQILAVTTPPLPKGHIRQPQAPALQFLRRQGNEKGR